MVSSDRAHGYVHLPPWGACRPRMPAPSGRGHMYPVTKSQTPSHRGLRMGVVAAAALSVAAFMPAVGSSHPYTGPSLGTDGSANAVERRLGSPRDRQAPADAACRACRDDGASCAFTDGRDR